MTVVSAAMGYGKTTSVKSYLNHQKKLQVVWVSLLGSYEHESVFWEKLIKSFAKIDSERGSLLKKFKFPFNSDKVQSIIDIIKDFAKDKPTVLVVDDYHIAEDNKNINDLLELLALESIPNFHMVIISRTLPKFNMFSLISKGLCYTIDAKTLAFTKGEIKEYFCLMKYKASEEELSGVYNYTKGWISAVHLMLLGLKQGHHVNEISNINKLVEENLYNLLSDEVREILLKLSIFDTFTLEQASYLTDNKKIYEILENMINKNAFIEYDYAAQTYKFHNVLRNYLRNRVGNFGIDETDIYHKAGKWFYKENNISIAFDFYHRAGKIEELLEMINRPDCFDVNFMDYKLHEKIYSIDKNLCIKYPFPFLHIACNFIVIGEVETVIKGIEIVRTMSEYFSSSKCDLSEKLRNRILGELEIIKLFIDFNDCEKMVEHANKAYELFDGGTSCIVVRNSEFTFGLPHLLYAYYIEPGCLKKTLECIVSGFPPPVLDYCGYGSELLALAEYYLETGNYMEVENLAYKALLKAKSKDQDAIIICAYFAVIRLKMAEGNFMEALNALDELKEHFNDDYISTIESNNPVYTTTLEMVEGYIYANLNNLSKVPLWLQKGQWKDATLLYKGLSATYIVYAKAAMLSGEWVKLEYVCEEFMEGLTKYHPIFGILYCLIYESVAKYKIYGIQKGKEMLLKALKIAEKDCLILPFAENADFILPILNELNEDDIDLNWLLKVTNNCKSYSRNLKKFNAKKIPTLTNRESQVLELLEQGLTQKEMAKTLFVSVSTVKRYLESLYKKLNANNKTVAINNAKKLKVYNTR